MMFEYTRARGLIDLMRLAGMPALAAEAGAVRDGRVVCVAEEGEKPRTDG